MRLDTKAKREASRNASIEWYKKEMNAEVKVVYDLTIMTYERLIRGKVACAVQIWKGSSAHTIANYYYGNPGQRQVSIDGYVKSAEDREARKVAKKLKKKSFKPGLNVGDILYTSWGYDQTNVDFYQVVEAKGCFVKIRAISSRQVEGSQGGMCCNVVAVKDAFLEKSQPMRKKVCEGDTLRMSSYSTAWKWDGHECYRSWYA